VGRQLTSAAEKRTRKRHFGNLKARYQKGNIQDVRTDEEHQKKKRIYQEESRP